MKTMKFLSMAALVLVAAVMTSCSSEDELANHPQQPENKSNVVTLTTTIGLDGGTRALSPVGTKTFAENETMALIYKNTSGMTVRSVSNPLTADDIDEGAKSAMFTFTLVNPDKSENVSYVYPAAMAKKTAPSTMLPSIRSRMAHCLHSQASSTTAAAMRTGMMKTCQRRH